MIPCAAMISNAHISKTVRAKLGHWRAYSELRNWLYPSRYAEHREIVQEAIRYLLQELEQTSSRAQAGSIASELHEWMELNLEPELDMANPE